MGSIWLLASMLVGVVGALLCALILFLEIRQNRRSSRGLAFTLSGLLAAGLLIPVVLRIEIQHWWPLLVFASLWWSGTLVPANFPASRATRYYWGGLMFLCALTAHQSASFYSRPVLPVAREEDRIESSPPRIAEHHGRTASGRKIPLFHYSFVSEDAEDLEYRLMRRDLAVADNYRHFVIRVHEANPDCNCHGLVFADGKYAIGDEQVEWILADNGYEEITDPVPDDLVIYRDETGAIWHSGIVRFVLPPELVLVESKWGPLGVYLHPTVNSPYGSTFAYYRTDTGSHTLEIRPNCENCSGNGCGNCKP